MSVYPRRWLPSAPRIKRKLVALALSTAWCATALTPAMAQDEETQRPTAPKLFPDSTLAYIRVDDVSQLREDMERSSLGKLGNDEKLKPILQEFYGSLVRNTEQMQEAIGLNLDEVLSIPSGEMAVALLPNSGSRARVDREGEDGEEAVTVRVQGPAVAILLDAGDEISGVQVLLQRMDEATSENMVHEEKEVDRLTVHRYQNPNRRQEQFSYFIDEGVIVACTDPNYIEDLANKWLGKAEELETLADNRKFTSLMSRCVGADGERPQVTFYADPWAMIRKFSPSNAGTMMTLGLLDSVGGLSGIEAVGGSWIVSPPDFDSISHMHVSLASPRRGVLSLLRPKSGSTDPEPWVPDSVASYSTLNWDLVSTFKGVERLYNQFRGEDALENQVFERVKERFDVDLRKDVLENLEGRVTIIQGFVRPVTINSGSNVYAVKLKNPDAFKKNVLPKVISQIEERTEVKLQSFGPMRVNVISVGNSPPENAPIRQPEICFTIHEDYLVIADSEYMMRQIADCLNGSVSPLSEALEYQLISDRIGAQLQDKECSAISYARPEETLQLFYELARDPKNKERLRGISEGNGFFQALLSALDKHELPPFSVIAKYLAPGGGFLVEEETGWHYMSFSLRRE